MPDNNDDLNRQISDAYLKNTELKKEDLIPNPETKTEPKTETAPTAPNYQDILDKYAASINSSPEVKIPEAPVSPLVSPESNDVGGTIPSVENIPEKQEETTPNLQEIQPALKPEAIPEPLVSPLVSPESNDVGGLVSPISPESQPQLESTPQPEAIPEPLVSPLVSPESNDVGGSIPETAIPSISETELPPESNLPLSEIPKQNNFFKYLFFFSLLIFIIVLVSVVISFINSQKSLTNSSSTPTVVSPSTVPNAVCQINNQNYPIGQSFAATDGCNTCTCNTDLTISCTELSCSATPTAKLSPTTSATNSAKITTIPSDLINLVKLTAATEAKTTISEVTIGETKIVGNYAQIAFGYTTGSGAVYWAAKVNGIWKIVTGGQEPPACSILIPYNFPSDFECNQ